MSKDHPASWAIPEALKINYSKQALTRSFSWKNSSFSKEQKDICALDSIHISLHSNGHELMASFLNCELTTVHSRAEGKRTEFQNKNEKTERNTHGGEGQTFYLDFPLDKGVGIWVAVDAEEEVPLALFVVAVVGVKNL